MLSVELISHVVAIADSKESGPCVNCYHIKLYNINIIINISARAPPPHNYTAHPKIGMESLCVLVCRSAQKTEPTCCTLVPADITLTLGPLSFPEKKRG